MSSKSSLVSRFDHLVVCARELSNGVAWFKQLSGLELPVGGNHPLMATHNHLTALSSDSFLEIIAVDPAMPAPQRKRWFNLDDSVFQSRLKTSPVLSTWVVGTEDLQTSLEAIRAVGIDAGEPVNLTRDDLQWQIALRADGTLACDGVFPILIQWPASVNPVNRMQDQGLRLNTLQLQHPKAEQIRAALQAIGLERQVDLTTGTALLSASMSVAGHTFRL